MMVKNKTYNFILFKAMLILLFSTILMASGKTTPQDVNTIYDDLENGLAKSVIIFETHALTIFKALAIADIVLSFGFKILKGTDFSEIIALIVKKILYFSFFLYLLNNASELMGNFFNGFIQIANTKTYFGKGSYDFVNIIFEISRHTLTTLSYQLTPSTMFRIIVIVIIVFAGTVIVAELFLMFLKFYILLGICYFALGLSGFSKLKKIAIVPLISIFKVGIELMLMTVIIKIASNALVSIQKDIVSKHVVTNEDILYLLITIILFALLVSAVPKFIRTIFMNSFSDFIDNNSGLKSAIENTMGFVRDSFSVNHSSNSNRGYNNNINGHEKEIFNNDPGLLNSSINNNIDYNHNGNINTSFSNITMSKTLKEKTNNIKNQSNTVKNNNQIKDIK